MSTTRGFFGAAIYADEEEEEEEESRRFAMGFDLTLQWSPWLFATFILAAIPLFLRAVLLSSKKPDPKPAYITTKTALSTELSTALPESVFFGAHPSFHESISSYFGLAQQSVIPECIVKPLTAQEVSTAIKIIKRHYDESIRDGSPHPTFAIRSGGHNYVVTAATARDGIVFDLRLLNSVELSEDRKSVTIGPGATWSAVSSVLDPLGLAVAAGRNAAVGVGGLALGGGISYFSPRVGFACDNITSYDIVLADGTLTTTTTTTSSPTADLSRALKGGSNNFGIVTSLTTTTFPAGPLWGGFLYSLGTRTTRLSSIRAMHAFIAATASTNPTSTTTYDPAASPMVCIIDINILGLTYIPLVILNLVHTDGKAWPACYDGFKALPRVFSSAKVQSITSAAREHEGLCTPGSMQFQATTTVANDLDTLMYVHATWEKYRARLGRVRGLLWEFVLQPMAVSMMQNRGGDRDGSGGGNCLGLEDQQEPLVIVLILAVWRDAADEAVVEECGRRTTEEIDAYAKARGTAHRYKYLNYCHGWQDPFAGYGERNRAFLVETSKKYDPDGFYQRARVGGYKLTDCA
ncbi:FAD-binding domain-containing protein [Pseudovirgaria hyperparasitica]|uniref:FAD-binding domain-containing protein n=1 Tax=Pseudovirgaria hyperparasitica TaxID=470096 RepID=A0A6A6W7F2_9PEZI|nr:FAD-binding domain-containing protein [Pseudovirgaria hyperparasitica]KAF2757954.1 FAD-binding domain-containing protein [Pseudovirgaria hyperparasitica]